LLFVVAPLVDSTPIRITLHPKFRNETAGQFVPVVPWLLCPVPNVPLMCVANSQITRRLSAVGRASTVWDGRQTLNDLR
jgi:hypothetical protein